MFSEQEENIGYKYIFDVTINKKWNTNTQIYFC